LKSRLPSEAYRSDFPRYAILRQRGMGFFNRRFFLLLGLMPHPWQNPTGLKLLSRIRMQWIL